MSSERPKARFIKVAEAKREVRPSASLSVFANRRISSAVGRRTGRRRNASWVGAGAPGSGLAIRHSIGLHPVSAVSAGAGDWTVPMGSVGVAALSGEPEENGVGPVGAKAEAERTKPHRAVNAGADLRVIWP